MNKGNKQLKWITVWFVLLPLCLAVKAQGASFDCGKATTKVEKMICADAELSKLDEELAKAYPEAMKKAPDPILFKLQQQDWLKERNMCKGIACLKDQYQLRIGELNRMIALVPLAKGQESHYFATQADKLKVMQDIVRRQAFVHYNPYEQEPLHCKKFMKDFIAGRNFVTVEPDFITNDEDDPRFERFNRCRTYENPQGTSSTDFYVIGLLGSPPYRYYHIDVDNNPENGKEDVVYAESGETTSNGTGYTWIDENKCTVRGGTSTGMGAWANTPRHFYRLNILVLYKGIPMSLEIYPAYYGTEPVKYSFEAMGFQKIGEMFFCSWSGVSDTKKKESKHNKGGK